MGSILWLIAAGVLALAELAVGDFALLMLGTAALITAGVALADIPLWAEILVFALSSLFTVLTIRPFLRRKFLADISDHQFSVRELEGRKAKVIEPITGQPGGQGMIRLEGELWTARAAHEQDSFNSGDTVQVIEIDGTTAVVWKGM